jgi:hypothetical protein
VNETELIRALSDVTKGLLEHIIWGKNTKTHGLIRMEQKMVMV